MGCGAMTAIGIEARAGAVVDDVEGAVVSAAIAALRRRAELQRKKAAKWTVTTERGVVIRSGEAAIAERIAAALDQAADDLARGPCP
jgi:hypothetical protein